jgi:hypothetical protein
MRAWKTNNLLAVIYTQARIAKQLNIKFLATCGMFANERVVWF